MTELYVRNKTGNHYVVIRRGVINATNEQDGQRMVHYVRKGVFNGLHFVREEAEFSAKFTKVCRAAD